MEKKMLRFLNKILNGMIVIVILLVTLYSVYSLWDNHQIYQQGLDLKVKLRDLKPKGHDPSFDELRKINPDVVAWITLDGTKIDEPIVQGKNNMEYLNKNVYGKYSMTGTVFLDSRCNPNFQSPYSLVYGHHVEKHLMFGDLDLYQKPSFIQKHHTGTLMIPGKKYPVHIFASMIVKSTDPYIFQPKTYSTDQIGFLNYVQKQSIWIQDGAIEKLENADSGKYCVLSLSTCYLMGDDRMVILAWYQKE